MKNFLTALGVLALSMPGLHCARTQGNAEQTGTASRITVKAATDKGAYQAGEKVQCTFSFFNDSTAPVQVEEVHIRIRNISEATAPVVFEKKAAPRVQVDARNSYTAPGSLLWSIPAGTPAGAYGLYLEYRTENGANVQAYTTFFRITGANDLTCFQVKRSNYHGLHVYTLHGGMSAEYAVEKSAENLTGGISHSWFVNAPGSGPEHVLATPQFLEHSVNRTVDFYNETLGSQTPIETVIIGAGIPSLAYLSRVLKAPVLPLHFLASSNSVKEIQSILDYSAGKGFSTYATIGHDASVPMAVTWVKLLEMPAAYIDFLKQHRVRQVVFFGYNGADGENTARVVINGKEGGGMYPPGRLYILYPGGGSATDNRELGSKLRDVGLTPMQPDFIRIADWESGITDEQVAGFRKAASAAGVTGFRTVTSRNMIALWDLGAYVMLRFMQKNRQSYSASLPAGITLNPYLIGHPVYESRMGYVPLLYWQLNPAPSTLQRVNGALQDAVEACFPGTALKTLPYCINSTRNFGGPENAAALKQALLQNGCTRLQENNYAVDEVWDSSDGMSAPVEKRAEELRKAGFTSGSLAAWDRQLKALSLEDLDGIGRQFPDIIVQP